MNLDPWDHLPPWMRGGMQDGGEGRGGMCWSVTQQIQGWIWRRNQLPRSGVRDTENVI